MHKCIATYMHTYIHTYGYTNEHAHIHACMHATMQPCIHASTDGGINHSMDIMTSWGYNKAIMMIIY